MYDSQERFHADIKEIISSIPNKRDIAQRIGCSQAIIRDWQEQLPKTLKIFWQLLDECGYHIEIIHKSNYAEVQRGLLDSNKIRRNYGARKNKNKAQ